MKATMMKLSDVYPMRWLIALCGLAMLLMLPQSGVAQAVGAPAQNAPVGPIEPISTASSATSQSAAPNAADARTLASVPISSLMAGAAKTTPAAQSGEEQEEAAKPGKPGQEGIKVHGHWIIDIRNPDGTLVEHRDFQNSLTSVGGYALVGLLSGQLSGGFWSIDFYHYLSTSPCGNNNICFILPSPSVNNEASTCAYYSCSFGLTVTTSYGCYVGGSAPPPCVLTLNGSFTALNAGAIDTVQTNLNYCAASNFSFLTSSALTQPADVSPLTCSTATSANASGVPFTSTTITPINVQSGQLIQISVAISFS